LIVCRDLPFDRKYYRWLIFLPSDNAKWQEFVKILFKENEKFYLELLREMRPKEYYMTIETLNVEELVSELSPEEQEERRQDMLELHKAELRFASKMLKALGVNPAISWAELIQESTPEELRDLVQMLKPEQRQELIEELLKTQNQPKEGQQN
jgi:hypothetical protein